MAGQCAVCRQTFTKADQFVIAGTEAVHRVCIAKLSASVANRLKQEVIHLRGAFDGAQADLQRQRQQVTDLSREADRLRRDLEFSRLEVTRMRVIAQDAETSERSSASSAERVITQVTRERDNARRERDAARAEIALHHVLSGTSTEAPPAKDDRDSTQVRFSLLELDET